MSDALNEPQAESVGPRPGIDSPVQPEPAAMAMPVASAFPDFGQGTGLDQTSATVPQSSAPADPMRGLSSGGSYRKQLPMSGLPPAGLIMVGLLTALLGAWAGLSVLVGPSFGWSPDGSPSWHWSLIHAALHVAPGGVALIAGIAMVATVPKAARGMGRLGAALAGLLAILAGAWLVVGPNEWLVLKPTQQIVFAYAAPMRSFTYVVGANLGPGLLLAVTGAFALAWAVRVAKVRGSA